MLATVAAAALLACALALAGPGSWTPVRAQGNLPALGDTDSNSKNDMVFRPDGTADFGPGGAGSITMLSNWKAIAQNQYLIEISTSGKLKTTGSHS